MLFLIFIICFLFFLNIFVLIDNVYESGKNLKIFPGNLWYEIENFTSNQQF